jgi:hypothetical protein
MADQGLPGLGGTSLPKSDGTNMELVMIQRPLRRVLAFTRRTIDDVINCPIARNEVIGYYKLYRWVQRESDISELEHQWNPNGLQG